jgi:hypothetical protein
MSFWFSVNLGRNLNAFSHEYSLDVIERAIRKGFEINLSRVKGQYRWKLKRDFSYLQLFSTVN